MARYEVDLYCDESSDSYRVEAHYILTEEQYRLFHKMLEDNVLQWLDTEYRLHEDSRYVEV